MILAQWSRRSLLARTIVYCYPRTGQPDKPSPPGWDDIPGARGCTPETCGFRDRKIEHVFYPVFPPDVHAEAVVAWLKQRG